MTRHRISTPILLVYTLVRAPAVARAQAQTQAATFTGSLHVGSAHPLGDLDSLSGANIHVDLELSYRLRGRTPSGGALFAKLLVGLNQFTAEIFIGIEHPRHINASVNLQAVFAPSATGLRAYLQAGPAVYWPKSGPSKPGSISESVSRSRSAACSVWSSGSITTRSRENPSRGSATIQLGAVPLMGKALARAGALSWP